MILIRITNRISRTKKHLSRTYFSSKRWQLRVYVLLQKLDTSKIPFHTLKLPFHSLSNLSQHSRCTFVPSRITNYKLNFKQQIIVTFSELKFQNTFLYGIQNNKLKSANQRFTLYYLIYKSKFDF
jgi:hypothetical protein